MLATIALYSQATLSVHSFTMHWYSQATSTFMSTVICSVCFFCTIISKDGFQVISSFIVLIYGLLARVMCSFPTVAETISRPLVVGLHRYKTSWETFICYLTKQKALPEQKHPAKQIAIGIPKYVARNLGGQCSVLVLCDIYIYRIYIYIIHIYVINIIIIFTYYVQKSERELYDLWNA